MKALFLFCLLIITSSALGQTDKSQRLFLKAEEAVRSRDFKLGKELYKKAIAADEDYGDPYLRLASLYSIYRVKDSSLIYFEGYAHVTPIEKVNTKIWFKIAELNYQLGNYKKAANAMAYLKPFGNWSEEMLRLEQNINFSQFQILKADTLKINPLPSSVNQFQLQYFPTATVDQQSLFFTKRSGSTRQFDEDIYEAKYVNGNWLPATSVSDNINTIYNEGACTISADGRLLIFTACDGERKNFGSCDLFISYKEGDNWSIPENMGAILNSKFWDSQPSLSADGKTLYFSSDRPGGFGKRDIWQSSNYNGVWGKPKNLGNKINTKFDETTPFIHANNQTLFFSSTGFDNMGGFDLFLSNKKGSSDWEEPTNLGYPINSHNDELSLFIIASGEKAFYSQELKDSNYESRSNIVEFKVALDTLLPSATYVTGIVRDKETLEALQASLEMVNLLDSTDFYLTSSDPATGRYYLTLREQTEFGVFIEKDGYLFEDLSFSPKSKDQQKPDTLNVELQPLREGRSIILDNIYFGFNDYQLDARSISELIGIVKFMQRNSELKFIIEGHTDSIGNETYNLDLSRKRAQSVFEYLINQGIKRDRLDFIGYGSSKPIEKEDHVANRRIEFRLF